MKKHVLSVLMAIVFVFSVLPISANATKTTSSTTTTTKAATKKGYVTRKTSDLGVGFIEAFEGYFQFQYWDYQHYTIGYGTTCEKDEYPGGISEAFAHQLLKKNLPSYEAGLNSFLKSNDIYVTQNQYDALVSFTYNFGAYVWKREPTIAKYLKNGIEKYTDKQIADAFGLWVNAGGVTVQGLVDRRAAEAKYFCTDDFAFNKEVYVVTDSVSVRSGASTSYSSLGSLKRGDLVVVTAKKYTSDAAWGQISYGNTSGWFSLKYSKFGLDETTSTNLTATCLYKVENLPTGIALYWKKVKGAVGYKIYKKSGNSQYDLIKTITSSATTTFIDTAVKEAAYSYYVVSYNNKRNANKSGECQISFVSSIGLKSLKTLSNGFKLTWKKKSNAQKYKVLRANESDRTFVEIATTTATNYTDTTAVGGVLYYYSVKVVTTSGVSGASEAKSGVYLNAPEITSGSNTKKAITISWTSVAKAKGYYVYRRLQGQSKKNLVATINNAYTTTYTDSNVVSTTGYAYYVKAFTTNIQSNYSNQFATKLYAPPKIKTIKAENGGIKLTWDKASGAASYNVYRRLKTESAFVKIANVKTNSFADTTVSGNSRYYYRLTTVGSYGAESYRSSAKSCLSISSTEIISATSVKKGVKLKWNKVSGAVSYSVYRYASKKYTLVKTVTTNSLVVDFGKSLKRTYAVKVNYSGATSDYSKNFNAYKLAKPTLKISKTQKGLLLSWNKVKNATGVVIYRKEAGGKFSLYTEQPVYEKQTFENSTTQRGKTYYYKIKVVGNGSVSAVSNVVKKKF